MDVGQNQPEQLKRAMTSRHLFMISLGGVIGTGFFLGTGYTIGQAGPVGAVLSYIVGGLIMYLTMLCLGELSVALPVSGSFHTYATKFVSPALGFAVGWIYWLGWAYHRGAGIFISRAPDETLASTSGCVDLVSHIWAVFVLIKCQVSESVRGVGVFLFNH